MKAFAISAASDTTLLIKQTAFVFLLLTAAVFATTASANVQPVQQWRFTVFLDDTEIGFHHFTVERKEDHQQIISEARFAVKLLFFTAYRYVHRNIEQWQGQCLSTINAITDDNGQTYSVSGKRDSSGFVVQTQQAENTLPACIKTFAYWDPKFLTSSHLLNSQTGELVAVNVEDLGRSMVTVEGIETSARQYRLLGEQLQIDLWYSDEGRWLALESLTEEGRHIRYQILQETTQ